ncbi:MAG: hypothetical protein JO291_09975 [Acidimicrobiia bacterium]|nr:hypothetical protein [Acidimicrobiia bacterium]
MELRYLYVGAEDTAAELRAWLAAVGGDAPRWRFQAFGADVAAVDPGVGPAVLVADHRPSGSILPIYAVDDLDAAQAAMEAGGWRVEGPSAGTPEGPTVLLRSPSGIEVALLRVDRPTAMEGAYADPGNDRRVMPD